MIHLDTHVAAWLHAGLTSLFPPAVRSVLEREELVVSPMVVLELQYLHEAGKTSEPAETAMASLRRVLSVSVSDLPMEAVVSTALRMTWTRDPFDRLITGQAELAGVRLLTKDRNIRRHFAPAFWG